jgi:hypothetical protein
VFVEPDARLGLGHDRRERSLADLKRIAPQVVAVQLDQVEGVQERAVIMAAVANEIERGNAVSSQATASPSMMQERASARVPTSRRSAGSGG